MEVQRAARNITHFLIFSLILIFTSNIQKTSATAPASHKNYRAFVKAACNSTTYPSMCYNSLSSYASAIKADPFKLCNTALNLNLRAAKDASFFVSKLLKKSQNRGKIGRPETPILSDCLDEIKDCVDELKQAIAEMKNIARRSRGGSGDTEERMANVRTWVSAAMTDEDTCTEGFEERKVNAGTKKKIKNALVNLSRMTSNSLALITALRY